MDIRHGNTLCKEERLSSRKDISALIGGGKWSSVGCLRYCFAPNGLEFSRIIVSVPKRLFKRAVKRNLLKRRIRESYRTQKFILNDSRMSLPKGKSGPGNGIHAACGMDILFQYTSSEVNDFETIKANVAAILEKIAK